MAKSKSKRCRAFVFTDWDVSDSRIKEWKALLITLDVFYCLGTKEVGKSGKPHIQGFIEFKHSKTISAAKKAIKLAKGWLKIPRGTKYECVKYCFEEEGHLVLLDHNPENTPKETDARDSSNQWELITKMIQEGKTEYDVMMEYPGTYARAANGIGKMFFNHHANELNKFRHVTVTYLWGGTGVGKTRSVIENHERVYRVTDYRWPFDGYRGEDVIIFEEFRSSISLNKMLIYLDGYKCQLDCRNVNKVSLWTKIFIISNIPYEQQYEDYADSETMAAWDRRIHHVIHMENNQNVEI